MVQHTTERLPGEDVVADQIRRAFRVSGGASTLDQNRAGLPVSTWRQVARRVARELDRPVETVANGDHAWAALRDWPRGPLEEELDLRRQHRAVMAAALPAP